MWESRPLPKIVRRPPCSSQREGVFFVPGISFLCPCRAWTGRCLLVLSSIPLAPAAGRLWCPVVHNRQGTFFCLGRDASLQSRRAERQGTSIACCPPCGQASIWREPVGRHGTTQKIPRSAGVVDRPRYQPGIFCWGRNEVLDCHPCLSRPLMPAAPRQEDSVWWQADWSGRLLVVFQGEHYAARTAGGCRKI